VGDRASLLGYKDVHSSKKGLFSFKFINQNLAQQTLEKFKGFLELEWSLVCWNFCHFFDEKKLETKMLAYCYHLWPML
jgi:hypothetical protein